MTLQRSNTEKTRLLVSVRNAAEATIAHSANCVSIIDVKEPSSGSLGNVSYETARDICNVLPDDSVKSIALGEAIDGPVWHTVDPEARTELLSRFQFAKVGLAGLANQSDWVQRWHHSFEAVPTSTKRVAVAYADFQAAQAPPIESAIQSATEVGCSVFLIDTHNKGQGGLLDLLSIDQLSNFIKSVKEKKLKVVLAGSLKRADIAKVKSLCPDLIAVRGVVCHTDRTSMIAREKIIDLGKQLTIPAVS